MGVAKVLKANLSQQLVDAQAVMGRDALQNTGQCPYPDGIVPGDDLMVFTVDLCGYAHVRAALPGGPVPQAPERSLQVSPAQVTGQSHSARTSSRTKWRRISPGRFIVPSK